MEFKPPANDSECDNEGAALVRRADDDELTVRRRLAVYQEQTAPLERFYRELTRGSGKAEALRAAQMEHIASAGSGDDRSHPFFWAGFQIIGDNQGLRRRLHRAPRGGL
jgi:adenylate kinase